ncbi:MAG: T9SS type A sorting domain-containing protein [Bacteroidetes bacterium]|jgi:hypothetical protein|nr:T9SS type A sorting domain-containing protein [Bacteroidota bacterium]MBT7092576.1 T9SS type A sorting domain-containing protein [Bacteroidota bacterium]MBT7464961.1 T9SS type A sorting domain-containing protein [Bacteroidota bacterium]
MNQIKKIVLILIIGFGFIPTHAQFTPDTLWTKTYGGISNDDAKAVIQTVDSCFVVLGLTSSLGSNDIWLLKINDSGDIIWEKTFGGSSGEDSFIVKQTADNGFIISANTESFGQGDKSLWLIKTDENGNEQWNKIIDNTIDNTCQIQYVSLTSDGGYIITGSTGDHMLNHLDAWLIKVDENGNKEWDKKIGGSGNQKAYTVFQLNDGGYILSGYACDDNNKGDFWLFKTDGTGNLLWQNTLGGSEWDVAYSMQITSDNGYILGGITRSEGMGEEDFWLIKTDSQGHVLWSKIYGEELTDYIYSIQQTQDGGYVAGGFKNSPGKNDFDFWVFKTDSLGEKEWSKTIGGARNDNAFSITQTYDQGYILAGRTNSFGQGGDDAYLVRIKALDIVLLEINEMDKSDGFLQLYPNPFTYSTTIEYEVDDYEKVTIKVFDLLGQHVKTLCDCHQLPGLKTIVWNGEDRNGNPISPGFYLINLKINNQSLSRQLFKSE